jgi:hypothetical protein
VESFLGPCPFALDHLPGHTRLKDGFTHDGSG